MENAYQILYLAILFALGIGILLSLIRAIRGPRMADRVMGINMIGTMTLLTIAVLALYLKESWLLDVSLLYGMISFLAVAVLALMRIDRQKAENMEEDTYE